MCNLILLRVNKYYNWGKKMKYYLVALFDEESQKSMEEMQRKISKKYKIYRSTPAIHLTLEVVDNPNLEKLIPIIQDVLKPYKRFKVSVNGALCFDSPYKSVNLKIENKGYAIRISRNLNEILKLSGFNVRENIDKWDLHVALANTNYAAREWSNKEYNAACEVTKMENVSKMATIDRIELWKPINNKKEMIVKSFPLREY